MLRDEYRRVVVAEKDRVHTYAAWLLRDGIEAADVTQDAMLRLWQHRALVDPASGQAWLMKTVHRLCIDRFRGRKRRCEVPLDMLMSASVPTPEDIESSWDDHVARNGVIAALGSLSPRDRTVILLREIVGMRYAEIADVLEQSVDSVKVTLHRARGRLRRKLLQAPVKS